MGKITELKPIKNKKGVMGIEDSIWVISVLFALGIFFLILVYTWSQVETPLNDALTKSTPAEAGSNVTKTISTTGTTLTRFNLWFPLLIIGFFGYVLLLAWMSKDGHPAFFFVGLIVLGAAIILAVVFSNIYEEIATQDTFTDAAADVSIMGTFMNFLPFLVVILFLLISIIIYLGTRGGSTGGL